MKNPILLLMLFVSVFILTCQGLKSDKDEPKQQPILVDEFSNYQEYHDREEIKFIWNDDEESIPTDGSLIKIEFSDKNIIYLCPIEDEKTNY